MWSCYQPLEQLVTSNGRCNVSECVQETFGRSATEEDGFLYGLVVRKTLLAACSFYDTARWLYWWLQLEQPYQVRLYQVRNLYHQLQQFSEPDNVSVRTSYTWKSCHRLWVQQRYHCRRNIFSNRPLKGSPINLFISRFKCVSFIAVIISLWWAYEK